MNARLNVLCAAVLWLVCGVGEAVGKYAPKVQVSPEQEKVAQKGQRAVKGMKVRERRVFLAYVLGLLYAPKQRVSLYTSHRDERFGEECGLPAVSREAMVVFPDGKEVLYSTEAEKITLKKWAEAGRAIAAVGNHAVCAPFEEDVGVMAAAAVRRHYSHLPLDAQDAFRAMLADAVYGDDGKPVKHGFISSTGVGWEGSGVYKRPYFSPSHGGKFKNRAGKELLLHAVLEDVRKSELYGLVNRLFWCMELVGEADVLAVMDEVDAGENGKDAKKKKK